MKFTNTEKRLFKMALCGIVIGTAAITYSIAHKKFN